MKLSKKSEYALRAMVAIARDPGAVHTIPQISRTEGIPSKFLEQILLSLRHAGLLTSKRGAGGGYTLQKTPARIHALEIIEGVEGQLSLPESEGGATGVDFFLHDLQGRLRDWLNETTLEDLLRLETGRSGAGSFEI